MMLFDFQVAVVTTHSADLIAWTQSTEPALSKEAAVMSLGRDSTCTEVGKFNKSTQEQTKCTNLLA